MRSSLWAEVGRLEKESRQAAGIGLTYPHTLRISWSWLEGQSLWELSDRLFATPCVCPYWCMSMFVQPFNVSGVSLSSASASTTCGFPSLTTSLLLCSMNILFT